MKAEFRKTPTGFEIRTSDELLLVESCGSGLRVRATPMATMPESNYSALADRPTQPSRLQVTERSASICVARICCDAIIETTHGEPQHEVRLTFRDSVTGEVLLEEARAHFSGPGARAFKQQGENNWRLQATFRPQRSERIFGMGQRQHGLLSQDGCVLELAHRNSEVSIPFAISSRGYGFLWNTPSTGRVEFGRSLTRWVADEVSHLDYWIAAGSPRDLLFYYGDVTGFAPAFPEWAMGLWQSKLRYTSQEEVLKVAHDYASQNLPLGAIVIDFFHWTKQGEWRFDPEHWPDPQSMVTTLRSMDIEPVVSIWPTVNPDAETASLMTDNGWLIRKRTGERYLRPFIDIANGASQPCLVSFYDPTHPGASKHVMSLVEDGYMRHGIETFWLDACEPELLPFAPEELCFADQSATACMSVYPLHHMRNFNLKLKQRGVERPVLLCRSAWVGSQKYGCLLWSGDISSTFAALRDQLPAGLNAGLSGIGWWTTDTGGFYDGDPSCPEFRELVSRWFQWSVFTPVLRLHGFRKTAESHRDAELLDHAFAVSGGPNELWSFGPEAFQILKFYLAVRLRLKPYLAELFEAYANTGVPPMRAMFLEFPEDPDVLDLSDQYMFGPDLLVAPILDFSSTRRQVVLPAGETWIDLWSQETHPGAQRITVTADVSRIPVFLRARALNTRLGKELQSLFQDVAS